METGMQDPSVFVKKKNDLALQISHFTQVFEFVSGIHVGERQWKAFGEGSQKFAG